VTGSDPNSGSVQFAVTGKSLKPAKPDQGRKGGRREHGTRKWDKRLEIAGLQESSLQHTGEKRYQSYHEKADLNTEGARKSRRIVNSSRLMTPKGRGHD